MVIILKTNGENFEQKIAKILEKKFAKMLTQKWPAFELSDNCPLLVVRTDGQLCPQTTLHPHTFAFARIYVYYCINKVGLAGRFFFFFLRFAKHTIFSFEPARKANSKQKASQPQKMGKAKNYQLPRYLHFRAKFHTFCDK